MSFRRDDEKLLEKYKAIWTKIEDLKNIELNALPVYDDRCIKTKIKIFGDKVYSNFHALNVPEDNTECESFTVISIDSLLVYDEKYYLKVYLDNCAYKIVNKQTTIILIKTLLNIRYYKYHKYYKYLYYDRVNISEGIDPVKSNKSRECMICHYCLFDHGFKFQDYVCNGCHDLTMSSVKISDTAIISSKNVDYRCIIHNSKSEAVNLLKNSILENYGYT